jgi:hypothetical protein
MEDVCAVRSTEDVENQQSNQSIMIKPINWPISPSLSAAPVIPRSWITDSNLNKNRKRPDWDLQIFLDNKMDVVKLKNKKTNKKALNVHVR